MKDRKKEIEDFYGKLKDPYYGRPIVLKKPISVGSAFTITNTSTSEVIQCHCETDDTWMLWGTSRHLEKQVTVLTHTELELLMARFWNLAQKGDVHWVIEDPTGCTLMSPTMRLQ